MRNLDVSALPSAEKTETLTPGVDVSILSANTVLGVETTRTATSASAMAQAIL